MQSCDNESEFSTSMDSSHCEMSLFNKIEVRIPDLNIKKIINVPLDATVGMLKKQFINSLSTDLKDAMNFGLFIPPTGGKAGKFLLEERTLTEYGLSLDNSTVELRYKRRLYRTGNINVARLKKLHSKANLKSFMEYVGNEDINKVTKMLNKGLDPNYQLKDTGETPLVKACSLARSGNMIKALVEGGAHLDFRHRNGHTPLHAASILGNLEAVKILLDLGQSPNTVDLHGLTPLYHSTINDTGAACAERLLYDHSAIGIEDVNGLQEIHQACRFGHVQHLELLLQYNADINSQTSKNGNTPLHICAYLNQENCARILLFRGADRSIVNNAGHTPYQQALLSDHNSIAMIIQFFKDEDIVLQKSVPKYNEKRKISVTSITSIHRSRSVGRMYETLRPQNLYDNGSISQQSAYLTRPLTRSIGKKSGTIASRLPKGEESSLFSSKRYSRSFSHLNQITRETSQNNTRWAPNWDADEISDNASSVSGTSPRKNSKNKDDKGLYKDSDSRSLGHSCSRIGSKGDLPVSGEIDIRYLPRMVALQKNTLGFGFVIRGLKDSTKYTFKPCLSNPALQYMEEVEPGSVAARAGILKGDYILEINNHSVVSASHEETVQLIKASGNILIMKVITVDKDLCKQTQKTVDQEMNSIGDCSDLLSLFNSEVRPQQPMSTFTGTASRAFDSGTISSAPYFITAFKSQSKIGGSFKQTSQFVPNIPLSDSLNSFTTNIQRNNPQISTTRPDSVASIDSIYPMPPPPSNDYYPRESRIDEEILEEQTHKRHSNRLSFQSIATTKRLSDFQNNDVTVVQPMKYAQPCNAHLPQYFILQNPCPEPPTPPPPPPPPPQPFLFVKQTPKPILKLTRTSEHQSVVPTNPCINFDNGLKDAIARRREKIDNGQDYQLSCESTEENNRQPNNPTSLSALKQNHQYSRSQSNHDGLLRLAPTETTIKMDENSSRMYLV